jgi:hypothetical protein
MHDIGTSRPGGWGSGYSEFEQELSPEPVGKFGQFRVRLRRAKSVAAFFRSRRDPAYSGIFAIRHVSTCTPVSAFGTLQSVHPTQVGCVVRSGGPPKKAPRARFERARRDEDPPCLLLLKQVALAWIELWIGRSLRLSQDPLIVEVKVEYQMFDVVLHVPV